MLNELDIRGIKFNRQNTDELVRWLNGGLVGKGEQSSNRSLVQIRCLNHLHVRQDVSSRGSVLDMYEVTQQSQLG